jgi:hypothetical protein
VQVLNIGFFLNYRNFIVTKFPKKNPEPKKKKKLLNCLQNIKYEWERVLFFVYSQQKCKNARRCIISISIHSIYRKYLRFSIQFIGNIGGFPEI